MDASGDYVSGVFNLVGLDRDCVARPVRKATYDADVTVHPFRKG